MTRVQREEDYEDSCLHDGNPATTKAHQEALIRCFIECEYCSEYRVCEVQTTDGAVYELKEAKWKGKTVQQVEQAVRNGVISLDDLGMKVRG